MTETMCVRIRECVLNKHYRFFFSPKLLLNVEHSSVVPCGNSTTTSYKELSVPFFSRRLLSSNQPSAKIKIMYCTQTEERREEERWRAAATEWKSINSMEKRTMSMSHKVHKVRIAHAFLVFTIFELNATNSRFSSSTSLSVTRCAWMCLCAHLSLYYLCWWCVFVPGCFFLLLLLNFNANSVTVCVWISI